MLLYKRLCITDFDIVLNKTYLDLCFCPGSQWNSQNGSGNKQRNRQVADFQERVHAELDR